MNVLFVTWDGPRLPYLEALFLPIFERLRDIGIATHVLQFGWSDPDEVERIARRCAVAGVPYRYRRVWRRPVSIGSLGTAVAGRLAVTKAIRDWAIDVVMPRSYLPAIAAIPPARAAGSAVLLDADGLPNDERLDFAGVSRGSLAFRVLDRAERWAVRNSDSVIVRTADAADILGRRAAPVPADRFMVVANARDEKIFRPLTSGERDSVRAELGVPPTAPLAIFVGSSVSGKYDGPGLIAFLEQLRKLDPASTLLIVTPDLAGARALVASTGVESACIVRSAEVDEVPPLIGAADVGLSLIHPSPSMRGASAIKTGEYLLCGIPVVATAGVGGVEQILSPDTGFVVQDHDTEGLANAARWVCEAVLGHRRKLEVDCRDLGMRHFAMAASLQGYRRAMERASERGIPGREPGRPQ